MQTNTILTPLYYSWWWFTGAIMATTLGITNTIDYKRNLKNHRPYIETTNLNINSYKIKTILDFWGSGVAAVNNNIYGYNRLTQQMRQL
jgi:hypothetical protein